MSDNCMFHEHIDQSSGKVNGCLVGYSEHLEQEIEDLC